MARKRCVDCGFEFDDIALRENKRFVESGKCIVCFRKEEDKRNPELTNKLVL